MLIDWYFMVTKRGKFNSIWADQKWSVCVNKCIGWFLQVGVVLEFFFNVFFHIQSKNIIPTKIELKVFFYFYKNLIYWSFTILDCCKSFFERVFTISFSDFVKTVKCWVLIWKKYFNKLKKIIVTNCTSFLQMWSRK